MTGGTTRWPLVDVVIPCFNDGRFLGQAVESVLSQTYPAVRTTIVDDGSTDNTREVTSGFGDRVRYVRTQHAGLSAARNIGIAETHGDLLVFLDADDYVAADAIQNHVDAARARPAGGVFYGSWLNVSLSGDRLGETLIYALADEPLHRLLEGYCPPCHSLAVRREVFEAVGTFDERLQVQEDWDMWLRVAGTGFKFVPVRDALAMYRRYSESMTRRADPNVILASTLRRTRKNAAWHQHCDTCRDLVRRCIRDWRVGHLQVLKREVADAAAHGDVSKALLRPAREVMRVPSLAPLLVRECFRLRDRHTAGQGRS